MTRLCSCGRPVSTRVSGGTSHRRICGVCQVEKALTSYRHTRPKDFKPRGYCPGCGREAALCLSGLCRACNKRQRVQGLTNDRKQQRSSHE